MDFRQKTIYFLYSLLLLLAALVGAPYWLYKALSEHKYLENFWQRLGWKLPTAVLADKPLWIHAVSVGEVLAAKALIAAISQARPELPLILSTITVTGQALARKEISSASMIFYFPFDWDFCVRRFLGKLQPRAVVLMETELWPNFLKECRQRRIPVCLANGRISDGSLVRYRYIKKFLKYVLRDVVLIGTQTLEDKRRFMELGATQEQVCVTGNLKFDFPVPLLDRENELLDRICSSLSLDGESPVIVVGSSMEGEETLFLEAFRRVLKKIPEARLILAPRHPERFNEVAELLKKSGIPFRRRSQLHDLSQPTVTILLLDTLGELRAVYSLASVAVIGGSFLPFGGHNLLEPAAFGKAIVFGPEMSNFREMAHLFLHEQAARQSSAESLSRALTELLENSRARNLLGQRALRTFRQNQGATSNTIGFLLPHIP